jgi:hypothetical protein
MITCIHCRTENVVTVKSYGSLTELLIELPSLLNQQVLIEEPLILRLLIQPTKYNLAW